MNISPGTHVITDCNFDGETPHTVTLETDSGPITISKGDLTNQKVILWKSDGNPQLKANVDGTMEICLRPGPVNNIKSFLGVPLE